MAAIGDAAVATARTVYMLEYGEYDGHTVHGPYLGASDLDFAALKAEYRAKRYAECAAAGEDFCHVSESEFVFWLVERGALEPLAAVTVDAKIDTDGEHEYAPAHWPLCPSCEDGRGEPRTTNVNHAFNTVEAYRRCTVCAETWDHRTEQWLSNRPVIPDDGRFTDAGCVPYAISQVSGIPMPDVLAVCRRHGWAEGQGMSNGLAAARELGLEVAAGRKTAAMAAGPKLTLRRFLDGADRTKCYLVSVRGHWLAVVRGEVRETGETGMRAVVLNFWEVRGGARPSS